MAPSLSQSAALLAARAGGKKRKRHPSDQQHGIDLPQIPGIPIEILPLHVQAVKLCSAFVRRHADKEAVLPYTVDNVYKDEDDDVRGSEQTNDRLCDATSASSVMDTLFHRIEQGAAQAEAQTDTGRDRRESLRQKEQAVTSWLQAIHRWIKDNNRHRDSPEEQKPSTSESLKSQ